MAGEVSHAYSPALKVLHFKLWNSEPLCWSNLNRVAAMLGTLYAVHCYVSFVHCTFVYLGS